jgi:hypothetical protein
VGCVRIAAVRRPERRRLSGKGTVLRHLPTVLAIILGMMHSATAESPQAQRGMMFARTYCATCHSIDKLSPSPLTLAPPFRALHLRYPVESLEEALAEVIRVPAGAGSDRRFSGVLEKSRALKAASRSNVQGIAAT